MITFMVEYKFKLLKTYIALLRGINVSGQKIIRMAELRDSLSMAGFQGVKTYIQSGNIIFKSKETSTELLADEIAAVIKKKFGFDVPVLVKSPEYLKKIVAGSPFPQEIKEKSYFTLLYDQLTDDATKDIDALDFPNEEIIIGESCIYYYCSTGYGRAKFNINFIERKYKINATSRNYRTMMKLLSLSDESNNR